MGFPPRRGGWRNGRTMARNNFGKPPSAPGFSCVTVAQGRAYTIGNQKDTDTVYCFDAGNGSNLWKYSYACPLNPNIYEGGPNASVTVDAGRAYVINKLGGLYCLDAETGKVIWTKAWPRRRARNRRCGDIPARFWCRAICLYLTSVSKAWRWTGPLARWSGRPRRWADMPRPSPALSAGRRPWYWFPRTRCLGWRSKPAIRCGVFRGRRNTI